MPLCARDRPRSAPRLIRLMGGSRSQATVSVSNQHSNDASSSIKATVATRQSTRRRKDPVIFNGLMEDEAGFGWWYSVIRLDGEAVIPMARVVSGRLLHKGACRGNDVLPSPVDGCLSRRLAFVNYSSSQTGTGRGTEFTFVYWNINNYNIKDNKS